MNKTYYDKWEGGKKVSDGMTEMAREQIESATKWDELRNKVWNKEKSDGSSADYYKLPKSANELQDLISNKNMNAQIGEIFRECYRYGQASHSDELRGIKKILFYANAELKRLTK